MKRIFFSLSFFLLALLAKGTAAAEVILLRAGDAQLTDGLVLKNGEIHKWNNVGQTITWQTDLKEGRYAVTMHYAEPYTGASVAFTVNGQEVVSLVQPTASWTAWRTSRLGVIEVNSGGKQTVTLQGRQLSLVGEENKEALPDVAWLQLTPTDDAATSTPVGISQHFKGKPIFDGKTLNGWEGNNGEESLRWFRVENGAIVAGSMKENIPRNEFLRTTKKYSHFELRLKFMVKAPQGKGWNGGVQFRSVQHPDKPYEMRGYQADIYARRWGGVYDESRRGKFLGSTLSEQPCKADEWNEYVLRCEGPHIRLWLNGKPVVDYIEPYAYMPHPVWGIIPQKGYIAVQVHERKNPFEVWYKDICLEELKVAEPQFQAYNSYGQLAYGTPTAERLGWKVGMQAYDLKRMMTFTEAIDMSAALGLKSIEGVGMRLSPETQETFGPNMSNEWKERIRRKLADAGVTLSSYYRRISARDAEKTIQFCKEMNMMLVTDPQRIPNSGTKDNPTPGSIDHYEALCKKYQVRMVLTNHPEADRSPYYDPDVVLADLNGRYPLLGASIDFGHFMRDGRDPLEIARKYVAAGRMHHFHFRDVEGLRPDSKDCIVGQGAAHIPEILQLLVEKDVKPIVAFEYERDMYNPLVDIIPSVMAFERILHQSVNNAMK
ncbi:MAG: family 16 glycoside hydrolase [Prevotella sp.]